MLAVSRQLTKSSVRAFAVTPYPEAWVKLASKELKGASPGGWCHCHMTARYSELQDSRGYPDEAAVQKV